MPWLIFTIVYILTMPFGVLAILRLEDEPVTRENFKDIDFESFMLLGLGAILGPIAALIYIGMGIFAAMGWFSIKAISLFLPKPKPARPSDLDLKVAATIAAEKYGLPMPKVDTEDRPKNLPTKESFKRGSHYWRDPATGKIWEI